MIDLRLIWTLFKIKSFNFKITLNYRFDMPAFLVVGLDSHGKNRLFAFGLLESETIEDFKWVFNEFKSLMNGTEPRVLITD